MRRAHRNQRPKMPRARDHNQMADAIDAALRPQPLEPTAGLETVLVQNDTGNDVDAWTVLGLDAPAVTPDVDEWEFRKQQRWIGVDPTDEHWNRFAILNQGCPEDVSVPATVPHGQLFPMRVDVRNAKHTHARPKIGESATAILVSDVWGCPIVWKEPDTTGSMWCQLLMMPEARPQSGYLIDTLESATVDVDGNITAATAKVAVYAEQPDVTPKVRERIGQLTVHNWSMSLEGDRATLVTCHRVGHTWQPTMDCQATPDTQLDLTTE